MATPHKHPHCELIKKWADDDSLQIECRSGKHDRWEICHPSWIDHFEYRIKPEVLRYRVALFISKDDKWLGFYDNAEAANSAEKIHSFIEWKTDWTEVEI